MCLLSARLNASYVGVLIVLTECDVMLQSSGKQTAVIDCRKSQNVTSHQSTGLLCTVDVPPKSAVVRDHHCYSFDSFSLPCVLL